MPDRSKPSKPSPNKRTTTALGDRPLAIDPLRLESLASAGCTDEEIAAYLQVPLQQLQRDYGATLERHRLLGAGLLRRKAFQKAVADGDPVLLRALLAYRCGVSSDLQLRELRSLQIEEQRVKLERAKLELEQQQEEAKQRQAQRQQKELEKKLRPENRAALDREISCLGLMMMEREERKTFLEEVRQHRESLQPWTQANPEAALKRQLLLLNVSTLTPEHFEQLLKDSNSTPSELEQIQELS